MSKRAIVIGINYVGKSNALKGCVNDAVDMRDVLVKKYGFPSQEIQVLIDDTRCAPGIPAVPPTKANVLSAWSRMTKGLRAGDQVVVTFSGHGAQAPNDGGVRDESDGKDECFLLQDGVLVDDEFSQMLSAIPAGVRVSVITDCCHSGTMCDLKVCATSDAPYTSVRISEETRAPTQAADILHFASAFDNQTASDGAFEGKWIVAPNGKRQWEWGDFHGAFTWSFLVTLEELKHARVPAQDLLRQVSNHLATKLKKTQRVTLSASRPGLLSQPFI